MEKSRTAARDASAAPHRSPLLRFAAITLSVLLTSSLLTSNITAASTSEEQIPTDTSLTADAASNDADDPSNDAGGADTTPGEETPQPETAQPETAQPETGGGTGAPAPQPAPSPEADDATENGDTSAAQDGPEDVVQETDPALEQTEEPSDALEKDEPEEKLSKDADDDALGTIAECFHDPAVATVIAQQLSKEVSDPFTSEDAESFTHLFLNGNNVTTLEGLQLLSNLTTLELYINNLSDISPLAGLTNLTRIDMGENNISDISALSDLTNLATLYLDGNQISDISALGGLPQLRVLWLDSNSIADLSPLTPLGNLSQVTAAEQNITLPRISVTRGSELRVASARGLNGELAAITGTSPDHGTSSEGIATWKDIAKAGDHALTFSSEPLLGRSSGTQGRISGRNASSLASAPSADVAVTYSGTLTQPVVVRDPAPTPETESTTPATPAAVDEASSTSDTGATPAVISTPPELARTGTDVTGLILTIILCALIGAGALIGVQKRRHLHRISTSL